MTTHPIDASTAEIHLGAGYVLRPAGLSGWVTASELATPALRASAMASTGAARGVLDASAAHMKHQLTLDLYVASDPLTLVGARSGSDATTLDVPVLETGEEHVLLAELEDGTVRWLFRAREREGIASPARTRGSTDVHTFVLRDVQPVATPDATSRGALGWLIKKLHVLAFPVTDPVFGAILKAGLRAWEHAVRAPLLRVFDSETRYSARPKEQDAAALEGARTGPCLLWVHGTASTAAGAFGGMPKPAFEKLLQAYGGKSIAYEHPTLSVDPDANARDLVRLLDEHSVGEVECDIVCHSRGGLVARAIAEGRVEGAERLTVRRLVMVGVPNAGTDLARPDRLTDFLDRATTVAAFLPQVGDALEVILTVVKFVAHAAVRELPGLAAMDPEGSYIKAMNRTNVTRATERWHAITSSYTPDGESLFSFIARVADDRIVDKLFEDRSNDLIVPQLGMADVPSCFETPTARRLDHTSDVMHTGYFEHEETARALLRWLS